MQEENEHLNSGGRQHVAPPPPPPPPPRIAVVQLLTHEVSPTYALSVSQIGCWCARRGYYHHVEAYSDRGASNVEDKGLGPLVRDAKIRHAAKYLPHYDWLLLLDADVNVANTDCRIESFLPPRPADDVAKMLLGSSALAVSSKDHRRPTNSSSSSSLLPWRGEFDLVLGVREHTGEPMSGAVLVRNSAWGRNFLKTWLRLSEEAPGADNKSMILALLEVLNGTLQKPTLPCVTTTGDATPDYFCLYNATDGKVGRLPHVLLMPAFHHIMTSLFKVEYGYLPRDCLVHGKEPQKHLQPRHGLYCSPREGSVSNWTRPELLRTDAEARDAIRRLKEERNLPAEHFTGMVQHDAIAECYPHCLDDSRVSWTLDEKD